MSHLNEVLNNKSTSFEKGAEQQLKVKYNEVLLYNYDELLRQEEYLTKELADIKSLLVEAKKLKLDVKEPAPIEPAPVEE